MKINHKRSKNGKNNGRETIDFKECLQCKSVCNFSVLSNYNSFTEFQNYRCLLTRLIV